MTRGVDSLSTEVKVPPFLSFSLFFFGELDFAKRGKDFPHEKKGSAAVNEMS